jgi:hypothetical protein
MSNGIGDRYRIKVNEKTNMIILKNVLLIDELPNLLQFVKACVGAGIKKIFKNKTVGFMDPKTICTLGKI